MEDDINFDFEGALQGTSPRAGAGQQGGAARSQQQSGTGGQGSAPLPPAAYQKNYRQTVCTYWLRGLCMRGDQCGFLHQYDKDRMPVCRTFAKTGVCHEADCPYKHTLGDIKECNMYKLGFCVYGPHCRYRHSWAAGPPPPAAQVAPKLGELHRIRARKKEQQARQQQLQQHQESQQEAFQSQQPQQPLLTGPQQQQQQQHFQQQHNGSAPMLALPAPGMAGFANDMASMPNGGLPHQQQQQQQQQQQHMRPPPLHPPPAGPRPPPGQLPQSVPPMGMSGGMGLVGDGRMEHLPSPLMFTGPPGGMSLPPPFLTSGMQPP